MFQTKLHVTAGGDAVLLPVHDPLEDDRKESDSELRRLTLQYRNRLEFAIGRTCSVDWSVAPDARRATAVWTTWLPIAETPQTQAREVENALLSMDALAQAAPEALRCGLEPLISGYATWLDEQEAASRKLPEHLRETADQVLFDARKVQQRLTYILLFQIHSPT